MSVYRVYWTDFGGEPFAEDFGANEMTVALGRCTELRKDKRISFVTLVAEDPNCTSLAGVAAPADDYVWEKRRGGRK